MPPKTATSRARSKDHQIISREKSLECVFGFIDADVVGQALLAAGHTPRAHVRKLILLASSVDERVRLAALKEIRSMSVDALKHSGYVEQQSATLNTPDGTVTATRTRLLARLSAPPPLPSASPSAVIVNPRKRLEQEPPK